VERGILAIGGLNQRISEMKAYTAMSGFRDAEVPIFEQKLSFLERQITPEPQEERFKRVHTLKGFQDLDDLVNSGKVDLMKVLAIRETKQCGSGSAGGDKREIVAMQKEAQTKLVHLLRLGKRQGLAHKACESLSQRVVPALDMGGLPGLFAARRMVLVGQDFLIGFPKVRKAMPAPKHRRNALPQLLTSGGAAIPRHIGNDLPGLAAQGNPDPMFIGFFHHK
jgi:hypothetical protein